MFVLSGFSGTDALRGGVAMMSLRKPGTDVVQTRLASDITALRRSDEIRPSRIPVITVMTRLRTIAAGVSVAVVMAAGYGLTAPKSASRSIREFEPDRLADLELRMWQAYYAKENVRLFGLLVTMLQEQYHYPWLTATREGFRLARASATFGNLREHYEVVIPDLEAAYGTAQTWLRAGFDPRAVARAELAWWVARRIPGQNDPMQVGSLIADEYAMLYEAPRTVVARAAFLRAQAAALRDAHAERPDWKVVGDLLRESYRDLHEGLAPKS